MKQYVDGICKQKTACIIWNGINANWYMAGIQKSSKNSKSKLTVYKALYKNFGIWAVYKQKKAYEIVYQPFLLLWWAKAIISASMLDKAVSDWNLDCYMIRKPATIYMYPILLLTQTRSSMA